MSLLRHLTWALLLCLPLAMAQAVGTLALVLRSSPDEQSHPNAPIYLSDLEGGEELALVEKWNSAFAQLARSTQVVGAVIRDVAQSTLDQEVKRLTDELAAKNRELEEARSGQQYAASQNQASRQSPTAVLTIRGNSQSYVTINSRSESVK